MLTLTQKHPESRQPNALIEATQLSAGYRSVAAVHDLDVHVAPGEIVGILGPNGAGKTTTVLALSGALPVLSGTLFVDGLPTHLPLHRRARQGLALVTEERSIFKGLTAAENFKVAGVTIEEAMRYFPELGALRHRSAGLLSGGEQQMVVLGRALSRNPRVLIADELSLGLAPLIVRRLLQSLRSAAEAGVGVVLVEQHIPNALEFADRIYVMRGGKVVLEGTAAEMRNRTAEIELAYLGGRSS